MSSQMSSVASFAAIATILIAIISNVSCQDYDGETETAITGLSGLSGLSGLANGAITGYAPMTGSLAGAEATIQNENQGLTSASENSDAEPGDYDEDSNDSSASEMHPILSKVISLISGGRHKRSITERASYEPTESKQVHRVKRSHHKGWVPYVSTYVKTDKKANFKWGVKAKVGKKYGRK